MKRVPQGITPEALRFVASSRRKMSLIPQSLKMMPTASFSSTAPSRHKEGGPPEPEPPSMFASNEHKSLEELEAELDRINKEIEAFHQTEAGKAARDAQAEYVNPHTGEIGGPRGPEPTRYGDYAFAGRVTDF